MSDILGFSTYPVKLPLHGGQRRIAAFAEYYRRIGVNYDCVCIYESKSYSRDKVGASDIPLGYTNHELQEVPFVGDLLSGIYGAKEAAVVEHFSNLVRRKSPALIVLEQPFMWPLVKRMRLDPAIARIPIVYSSQNWEAPLKLEMLVHSGVDRALARKVAAQIDQLEREAVEACDLIFACSHADAAIYREIDPQKRVIVVKNGVTRPRNESEQKNQRFCDLVDRYMFFVGSSYPPNSDGLCNLLLEDGLFFMPPKKGFAICGGASEGIFRDARYQRFLASNGDRVNFYTDISDHELGSLKASAHVIILPINFGGGSNLKTAEALATGKWVVATSTAMRGFEEYLTEPGLIVADGRLNFRKAVIRAFNSEPLQLSTAEKDRREAVYWDRCLAHVKLSDLGLVK